jgi:hypothetical protein
MSRAGMLVMQVDRKLSAQVFVFTHRSFKELLLHIAWKLQRDLTEDVSKACYVAAHYSLH